MAARFANWAEGRVGQAILIWAEKFGHELWEEEIDRVSWEGGVLRIAGVDGKFDIMLDLSGHGTGTPHINLWLNGGAASDALGNHWDIPRDGM